MAFVSNNYRNAADAPVGDWVCTRTSGLGPYGTPPPVGTRGNADYCGQCVSYVTRVCPTIPVRTSEWVRGALVKGDAALVAGTAIATFDANGRYSGMRRSMRIRRLRASTSMTNGSPARASRSARA